MMTDGDKDRNVTGDASGWPSGELLRLIFVPSIVMILFISGVYWLRLQVDSAGGSPEPQSVVQVQLLPRPDPLPIPVSGGSIVRRLPQRPLLPRQWNDRSDDAAAADQQVFAALPAPPAASPALPSVARSAADDAPPDPTSRQIQRSPAPSYPALSALSKSGRVQGAAGTVTAVFSMDRGGKLLGVWIKSSSGQAALDQAAIDTIRRAQPLPAIPRTLPDSMKIEMALGFDSR